MFLDIGYRMYRVRSMPDFSFHCKTTANAPRNVYKSERNNFPNFPRVTSFDLYSIVVARM